MLNFVERTIGIVIAMLGIAFLVALAFSKTLLPDLPFWVVAAPFAGCYGLAILCCIVTDLLLAFITHKARLQALCFGFSFKPFDWRGGDVSHLRKPGGVLWAFGPFRLAWRTKCAPTPIWYGIDLAGMPPKLPGFNCRDFLNAGRTDWGQS